MDPFIVTLIDSNGVQVASKTFTDSRTFYLWEDINLRVRYVRLDSLDYTSTRYFVICGVEVFGSSSKHPVWPDLTLLSMQKSNVGASCKETCISMGMICEPAHFGVLNNLEVLQKVFSCSLTETVSTR